MEEGDDDDDGDGEDDEVAQDGGYLVAPGGGGGCVGGGDGDGLTDGVAGYLADGVVDRLRAVTKLILGGGDADGVALGLLEDVDGVVEVDGVVTDCHESDGVVVLLLGGEGDVTDGAAGGEEKEGKR